MIRAWSVTPIRTKVITTIIVNCGFKLTRHYRLDPESTERYQELTHAFNKLTTYLASGKDEDSDFSDDEDSRPITLEFVLKSGIRMNQADFDRTFADKVPTEAEFKKMMSRNSQQMPPPQPAPQPTPPRPPAPAATAPFTGKRVVVCGTSREEVNGCVGKVGISTVTSPPPIDSPD